jgi:hypothetical protein
MEKVQVINGSITLPPPVVKWIGEASELTLFIEGDALIFKRLQPPRLSEIAARAPEDKEMPLDEIVAEVHQHRRDKRHARRR